MNWFNARLTDLAGLCLSPFQAWPPQLVIVLLSVVAGAAMTVVFRYTSNQRALRRVADRTKAQLLCLRLFKDDLGVALRAQEALLKATGLRLVHSVPPMLVLIVPFVLILTQMALRFEKRPLRPGESAVVSLELSPEGWSRSDDVTLRAPRGVAVETPPLRDPGEQAIYWRLRLEEPTDDLLRFRVGFYEAIKSFVGTAEDRLCAVNPRRPGPGFWDRLLYPGEPGFGPDWPVRGVEIRYPDRSSPFFGIDLPWWASFFILCMITALLVRPLLRVQF